MNQETPLQTLLLKSLLDLVLAVAWFRWRRVREWNDEREARAKEQTLRVIHLEPWRWTLTRTPPALRVEPRRVRWDHARVVAVLVSQPQMAHRVRRALGERTTLCYAQTWAELRQIVARVSASAIIADPAADERGDPARQLARFSHDWGIPVVLYTHLSPRSAGLLLQLGQAGIRRIVFYRYDDGPRRFIDAIDWETKGSSGPPLEAA